MASQWRLADHGDRLERAFGLLFGEQFPSYEIYWRKYSVPLTKREDAEYSHHFKSDKDLAKLDPPRTKFDLDLATLHYATFWHLCAAYRLRHLDDEPVMELDTFVHCITRLSSARDTAAAFAGIAHSMGPKAKRAREAWFNAKPSKPMQLLGAYRNFLVHGAPFMQLDVNGMYPRVSTHRPRSSISQQLARRVQDKGLRDAASDCRFGMGMVPAIRRTHLARRAKGGRPSKHVPVAVS